MVDDSIRDVAIVGAGPIGLEVAWALRRRGLEVVQFDKGQIASTIAWFPQEMTFFSSNDRIGIAGVPLQTPGQRKCTKEEYLAYLRTVAGAFDLRVRTFEEVTGIRRRDGGGFELTSRTRDGEARWRARHVVVAVGDMARPRALGIPGEDLPHVGHYFVEPHRHFRRRLLVVGGRNSAVEAALRCWHAGADVALSYRRSTFDETHVKYWLLPELRGRIERGEILFHAETVPARIDASAVTLRRRDGSTRVVPADDVLLLTGYVADLGLLEAAGVCLEGEDGSPRFDPRTMETNVSGLYVAGTTTAGTQASSRGVFIENCHVHGERIAAAILGQPAPADPPPLTRPES